MGERVLCNGSLVVELEAAVLCGDAGLGGGRWADVGAGQMGRCGSGAGGPMWERGRWADVGA